MHKFTSEYGEGFQPEKIEITVSRDATLTEMLESFTYYLKACGYFVKDGDYLDFVNDEYAEDAQGWDSMETVSEDFDPRGSIDSATYEDWNNAYKNVTVSYKGNPVK